MTTIVIIAFILCICSLFCIMPRVVNRPDTSPFDGWFYAHRGLHDNESIAPENSLKAFSLAVKSGYGIELDIRLSKDHIPVVFHDHTLERVCGVNKRVEELTLKELKALHLYHSKETIPTLREALDVIQGKVPIIVEFKIPHLKVTLCDIAAPILDKYKGPYCIESFHPLCLRWFKHHRKQVMRGQLSSCFVREKEEGNPFLYFILTNLLLNWVGRPDFISYHYKYPLTLSLSLCRDLFHIPTAAWTVKDEESMKKCRKYFEYIIFEGFLPKNGRTRKTVS